MEIIPLNQKEFEKKYDGRGQLNPLEQEIHGIKYAPHETTFLDVVKQVEGIFLPLENTSFFGIGGGIDLSLMYLLLSNAEQGFLFDYNPKTIDYSNERLELFKKAENKKEYFELFQKKDFKAYNQLEEYICLLEKRKKDWLYSMDPLGQEEIGLEIAMLWWGESGFEKLKELVEQDRIKTFKTDYYLDGMKTIGDIIKETKTENTLIYLSCIADMSFPAKNDKKYETRNNPLIEEFKKNHLDCGIIIESGTKKNNYVSEKFYKENMSN
jgi:hypothetical protein